MASRTRDAEGLLDRERAFVEAYITCGRKGVEAARQAGYEGSPEVLKVTASRLLTRANVRAAYENRLHALQLSTNEILGLLAKQATADRTDYLDEHGNFDVKALRDAGMGWMLEGIETDERCDKDGNVVSRKVKIKLASGHEARKLVMQHLGLLGDNLPLPSDPEKLVQLVARLLKQKLGHQMIDVEGTEVPN